MEKSGTALKICFLIQVIFCFNARMQAQHELTEGIITGWDVRLRKEPTLNAEVIGLMSAHTPVKVIGKTSTTTKVGNEEHHWYQIEVYDKVQSGIKITWTNLKATGWVYGKFIRTGEFHWQEWYDSFKGSTPLPPALMPLASMAFNVTIPDWASYYNFSIDSMGKIYQSEGYENSWVCFMEKATALGGGKWNLTCTVWGTEDGGGVSPPFPAEHKDFTLQIYPNFDSIHFKGRTYHNSESTKLKIVKVEGARLRKTGGYDPPYPARRPLDWEVIRPLHKGELLFVNDAYSNDTVLDGMRGKWMSSGGVGENEKEWGVVFDGLIDDPDENEIINRFNLDSLAGDNYLPFTGKWESADGQKVTMDIHRKYIITKQPGNITTIFRLEPKDKNEQPIYPFQGLWLVQDPMRGNTWIVKNHYDLKLWMGGLGAGQKLQTEWPGRFGTPIKIEWQKAGP